MKQKMTCSECKGHNMGLMEIDFDLRKIARQAMAGRNVASRLADQKERKAKALQSIEEHRQREHAA